MAAARPLDRTHAATLFADVSARPKERLLVGIAGAGGSGKTALLDRLEATYRARGIPVSRDHAAVYPASPADPAGHAVPSAVLVDDAHRLGETELGRLQSMVDGDHADLVVAYRSSSRTPALDRLVRALERHRPQVVLDPLGPGEVQARIAAVTGAPAPPALVADVLDKTGGMAWLVARTLPALGDGDAVALDPQGMQAVAEQLGRDLQRVDEGLRHVLLSLAAGFDSAEVEPPWPDFAGQTIDELVDEARTAGLLLPDGRLIPLVRQALIGTMPRFRLRSLQRALVDGYVATGCALEGVARDLARSGVRDIRVARALEQAGDGVLGTDPARALQLYDEAKTAGADGVLLAPRRAQAALAGGDLEGAGRIVDGLLALDSPPDAERVANTAAAIWSRRGLLARGADAYRWLGPARTGESSSLAAVALVGVGDLAGARSMLETAVRSGSPTLHSVAAALMGQGCLDAAEGRAAEALSALVRASDTLTAAGALVPLPELPAVLAALVALHCGKPGTAESILAAALAGGQGGKAARPRMLLLQAWSHMLLDRPERARALMAEATGGAHPATPRDKLFLHALAVGLARRADDLPALVRAWRKAREHQMHVVADLYCLLPLGELAVAGARLRDDGPLQPQLEEAWAVLGRLGDPPLWAVPLHWYSMQAALLAERPHDLAPHAAALARAASLDGPVSRLASRLATAGKAWVAVLAGEVDAAAVESAANGLAGAGLAWEGARLAGHAAGRADDRRDMHRLLSCARDLRRGAHAAAEGPAAAEGFAAAPPPGGSGASTGGASAGGEPAREAPAGPAPSAAALSPRERDVARLVLQGKTYREIGEAMFISPRTAEHHIARIRHRLGAATRPELLARLRLVLDGGETGAAAGGGDAAPVGAR
ncbi:LuxR C-terminal-related transcriptional regulator [Zafaria cholistanensis]|nr:LuxR C-terminal-related transcriptional regulator [Zafaria cholistanensis]